jgi:adenosylmethionine-8-amino-7-oxononanoate aminotransferase
VPAVNGYLQAMQAVCSKYGALLIFDEIMSGMGRCGTLHAWQHDGVVPDIQTIGKGLGGGYAPVAGLLIKKRVVDALDKGTGAFAHGQTYQGHPIACTAALEVQRIIREENLVANVAKVGAMMGKLLVERLGEHLHVGNIRGRGLFWGVRGTKFASLPIC